MVASEIVVMTPGMGDSSIYASSPTRPASWLANTPEVAPACWGGGGRLFPTLLQSPPKPGRGHHAVPPPPPLGYCMPCHFQLPPLEWIPPFELFPPPFFLAASLARFRLCRVDTPPKGSENSRPFPEIERKEIQEGSQPRGSHLIRRHPPCRDDGISLLAVVLS